ncbi:GNAT family N-acetyltransferase [Sphingobacterium kitahiroshimense]|uniref:GNAT family N-acetyltransferase n=1 Tax=Sphingobacterium kitahiroshimense TaxID=470446 RepID=A0ABV0BPT7_9SPHI
MQNIAIKRVTLDDITVLQKIGRETFFETFSNSNSEENMQQYLEDGFSVKKLREELGNRDSEFYFAVHDEYVIGYLKLNYGRSQTELKNEASLEIERIYVLQKYQGKKKSQILYEKAIQIAHDKQVKYVWLGVWEQNLRAINFYKKNDFIEFDKHIFKLGNDAQTDIMMKKNITI